jgi:hypothetical protein
MGQVLLAYLYGHLYPLALVEVFEVENSNNAHEREKFLKK